MKRSVWLFVPLVLTVCPGPDVVGAGDRPGSAKPTPREVFEKRLMPIFRSPKPSSCVQCHLAGVAIKDYILPSHQDTFVSLRDQGLIDLDHPEKSRILVLIKMGEEDSGGAARVHQKTRQAEYEAFADWIKRSATDPKLRALPKLSSKKWAKPKRPNEVVRHGRKDRVLESFTNTIWAARLRCINCHTESTPHGQRLMKKFGKQMAWVKTAGPEETLDYLRSTDLLNVDAPEKSLLLLKPLNEVKHAGGVKFARGDDGYQAFRTFVEDYARVMKDRYPNAKELPNLNRVSRFSSRIWLKLANTPPAWGGKLLQVELYAWDAGGKAWEPAPIATADRLVWGKGNQWLSNLTLVAPRGSKRATTWAGGKLALPRGRYLLKARLDRDGKLAANWKATLSEADFVGTTEVASAWLVGPKQMTVIKAVNVKK